MKALSTLKSAINQSSLFSITALTIIAPLVFPQLVAAAGTNQASGITAQVFEIKVTNPELLTYNQNTNQTQQPLTLDAVVNADPLTASLQAYLQNNNSPLAPYTSQILSQTNWKQLLAVSFVESQFCIHQFHYNCSGIGGQEYLRQYNDFGEWINDMSGLLHSHYEGWSFKKMDGIYVQPYSANWLNGSQHVYDQLTALEQSANEQRAAMAQAQQIQNHNNAELATIAQ